MNRADLERLGRDDLITRAETAGVTRARILTRPELVDELLLRSSVDHATKQRSRGFFGRARDLLASVVEQGLNLPDAAQKIRALGAPPPSRATGPAALPTVTLAEIYVAQGHRGRAVETLDVDGANAPRSFAFQKPSFLCYKWTFQRVQVARRAPRFPTGDGRPLVEPMPAQAMLCT